MTQSKPLADRTREKLSGFPVTEKKMFGGLAFMVNDKMCVTVRPERMMFRIDPQLHDEVVQREGCTTVVMKNREYKGYVFVDAEILNSKPAFDYFMTLAIDFNHHAKSSVKTKKSVATKISARAGMKAPGK